MAESLEEAFSALLNFTRASERIGFALAALKVPIQALAGIAEIDPELGPEVSAALNGLDETGAALGRAFDFINARVDAQMGKGPGG